MRTVLMLWWAVCVGESWVWSLDHQVPGVAVVSTGAATVFVALLWWVAPRGWGVRAGVYVSALVALQLSAVVSAVWPLQSGHTVVVRESAASVAVTVVSAALAVVAWLLVRAWLSAGRRRFVPRRPAQPWRDALGLAALAAVLYLAVNGFADRAMDVAVAGFGVAGMSGYPDMPGGADLFGWAMVTHGLAGAVEEPVYVGLLALMWPRLRWRTFVPLAVVSSLARASMHLFYAAGTTPMAGAIAAVVLWCAIWSSTALALVYWSRMLWPVVVAHGLLNALGVATGPYDLGGNALAYSVAAAPFVVLVVIWAVGVKDGFERVQAFAVSRGWVRSPGHRAGEEALAGDTDLAVQIEGGGQATVDSDHR